MIWRHIHSLLASAVVMAVLLVTRPDFEVWYLTLPALTAGGGITVNITVGRRRRRQSPMLDSVDDEIEAKRRWWEFQKKVERDRTRTDRRIAYGVVIAMVLVIGLPILGVILASPGTVEVVRRWLGLFGCSC